MPDPNCVMVGDVAFLVPAKNASTSVLTALCWQTGREDPGDGGIHGRGLFPYLSFGDVNHGTCHLVGVVRDPLARALSAWRNKCFGRMPGKMRALGFEAEMAWSAFVDAICEIPDGNADMHFRSQAHDLLECLSRPVAKLLRVESLAEDWADVERWLGWPAKGIPWRNRSNEVPAPAVTVTERQRRRIAHRYRTDYHAFGYDSGV